MAEEQTLVERRYRRAMERLYPKNPTSCDNITAFVRELRDRASQAESEADEWKAALHATDLARLREGAPS